MVWWWWYHHHLDGDGTITITIRGITLFENFAYHHHPGRQSRAVPRYHPYRAIFGWWWWWCGTACKSDLYCIFVSCCINQCIIVSFEWYDDTCTLYHHPRKMYFFVLFCTFCTILYFMYFFVCKQVQKVHSHTHSVMSPNFIFMTVVGRNCPKYYRSMYK